MHFNLFCLKIISNAEKLSYSHFYLQLANIQGNIIRWRALVSHRDSLGGCLLLLLRLLLLLEPLLGVYQLRTQDDISLFLVLLVELQIEIQYNTIHHEGSDPLSTG